MISLNDVSLCFSDTAAAHIIQISCHECLYHFQSKEFVHHVTSSSLYQHPHLYMLIAFGMNSGSSQ